MEKWYKDKELIKKFKMYFSLGTLLIIVFALIQNLNSFKLTLRRLLGVLSPFIWGIFLVLILLKIAIAIEESLPKTMSDKTKRVLSSILAVLIAIFVVVIFFLILIPNIITSIGQLAGNIDTFTTSASEWLTRLSKELKLSGKLAEDIYEYSNSIVTGLWSLVETGLPSLISLAETTVTTISNFLIGFFVAIYILIDRENLHKEIRMFGKAILPEKVYRNVSKMGHLANEKFNKFFVSKLVDSLIIGILCAILMSILRLNYVFLISVIVGITNIIPFFGPIIGAIPSILILLIVSPKQAIIFAVLILALQQLDGQIIGPRILGESVGLSSLWIMFAIIVGGAYFGFFGMLLGVPVFSIIYFMLKDYAQEKTGVDIKNEKPIKINKKKTK